MAVLYAYPEQIVPVCFCFCAVVFGTSTSLSLSVERVANAISVFEKKNATIVVLSNRNVRSSQSGPFSASCQDPV